MSQYDNLMFFLRWMLYELRCYYCTACVFSHHHPASKQTRKHPKSQNKHNFHLEPTRNPTGTNLSPPNSPQTNPKVHGKQPREATHSCIFPCGETDTCVVFAAVLFAKVVVRQVSLRRYFSVLLHCLANGSTKRAMLSTVGRIPFPHLARHVLLFMEVEGEGGE